MIGAMKEMQMSAKHLQETEPMRFKPWWQCLVLSSQCQIKCLNAVGTHADLTGNVGWNSPWARPYTTCFKGMISLIHTTISPYRKGNIKRLSILSNMVECHHELRIQNLKYKSVQGQREAKGRKSWGLEMASQRPECLPRALKDSKIWNKQR